MQRPPRQDFLKKNTMDAEQAAQNRINKSAGQATAVASSSEPEECSAPVTSGTLQASSCSAERSAHGSTGRRMWGLLAGEARYESRLLVKMKAQAGKSCWNRAAQAPRRLLEITPPQHKTRFLPQALQCSTSWFNLIWVFSRQAKIQARILLPVESQSKTAGGCDTAGKPG